MVSSTRRSPYLAPSGLSAKIKSYIQTPTFKRHPNPWIQYGGDKIYIRSDRIHNKFIDLANWQFKNRGKGHASKLLDFLEKELKEDRLNGIEVIKVGQVSNPKFKYFFERRPGWEKVKEPGITGEFDFAPTFMFCK